MSAPLCFHEGLHIRVYLIPVGLQVMVDPVCVCMCVCVRRPAFHVTRIQEQPASGEEKAEAEIEVEEKNPEEP